MKKLMMMVLLLTSSGLFAVSTNAGHRAWDSYQQQEKWSQGGGFQTGYFEVLLSKMPWSDSDLLVLYSLLMQTAGTDLAYYVDQFYRDPANGEVGPAKALRLCLEMMISRLKDGPRILKVLGVDVASLPNLKARQ